jgi:branched-subunit amino acid transport protein
MVILEMVVITARMRVLFFEPERKPTQGDTLLVLVGYKNRLSTIYDNRL